MYLVTTEREKSEILSILRGTEKGCTNGGAIDETPMNSDVERYKT